MHEQDPEATEVEIVARILDRSPDWRELLSALLQRYHTSLLTRCYIYLHNRQDAEDAAQETEIRVFRAIHRFRREASFRTWLFAIADRQCHDQARRRSRHLLSDQIRSLIEIHEESLTRQEDSADSRDLVKRTLETLPRRERDILRLRFYADLSFREMARHLGLGLSATKMRHYRALELFGARLRAERDTLSVS